MTRPSPSMVQAAPASQPPVLDLHIDGEAITSEINALFSVEARDNLMLALAQFDGEATVLIHSRSGEPFGLSSLLSDEYGGALRCRSVAYAVALTYSGFDFWVSQPYADEATALAHGDQEFAHALCVRSAHELAAMFSRLETQFLGDDCWVIACDGFNPHQSIFNPHEPQLPPGVQPLAIEDIESFSLDGLQAFVFDRANLRGPC
jgi:hypothetical protein